MFRSDLCLSQACLPSQNLKKSFVKFAKGRVTVLEWSMIQFYWDSEQIKCASANMSKYNKNFKRVFA